MVGDFKFFLNIKTDGKKQMKKSTAETAVDFVCAELNLGQLRTQENFSALNAAGELDLKQILIVGITIIAENGSGAAVQARTTTGTGQRGITGNPHRRTGGELIRILGSTAGYIVQFIVGKFGNGIEKFIVSSHGITS